jgi:hypothetical protein
MIAARGIAPNRGRTSALRYQWSRDLVEGRRSAAMGHHRSSHFSKVTLPLAGSVHVPRSLLLSIVVTNRSASTFLTKLFDRSRPVGSR